MRRILAPLLFNGIAMPGQMKQETSNYLSRAPSLYHFLSLVTGACLPDGLSAALGRYLGRLVHHCSSRPPLLLVHLRNGVHLISLGKSALQLGVTQFSIRHSSHLLLV